MRRRRSRTARPPARRPRPARRPAAAPAALPRLRSRHRDPGAGAITSTQMPSRCTVSTTGHAAPWPNGDRATSAASSRRIATRSSTRTGIPSARLRAAKSRASSRSRANSTPRPSYPPRAVLSTIGWPMRRTPPARRGRSPRRSAESAPRWPPAAVRITNLSWAWISASGGGATLTPSATSFSSSSVGTCSWSKVNACGALGRAAKRVEVGVRTDHHVGCDLCRRIVGCDGQHTQRLPERDRGLMRHPGQLSAADHGHLWVSAQRSWCHGRAWPDLHGCASAAIVSVDSRCRVLHRCHDRAAAPPDPAVLRTAPRAHQVRDRRRDDVRHRLGGVLHAEADGAGAQAGHREDHRRHRRGDRVLHPQSRVELPEPRRPRAPPRGAAVLRRQRCRRAAVDGPAVVLQLRAACCASPTCR